MPFYLVRNDITRMRTDAIVNAANERLAHDGGVAAAIASAAGRKHMAKASARVAPCPTGGAVWTPGFMLPAKYVIHAVGPVWRGGAHDEPEQLASAYSAALAVALELGCRSVAFPLLSAGIFGFPQEEAFQIAVDAIDAFLEDHDMAVYLVLFNPNAVKLGMRLDPELDQFIDDAYVQLREDDRRSRDRFIDFGESHAASFAPEFGEECRTHAKTAHAPAFGTPRAAALESPREAALEAPCEAALEAPREAAIEAPPAKAFAAPSKGKPRLAARAKRSIERAPSFKAAPMEEAQAQPQPDDLAAWLEHLDASFSDAVFALIDAKGLTDPQVYKRVHMSRQAFAKLHQPHYHPSKSTAIVLAIALELDYRQTQELLARAGYTLSPSSMQDRIVEFFIRREIWDIAEVNHALWERDQPLLQQ